MKTLALGSFVCMGPLIIVVEVPLVVLWLVVWVEAPSWSMELTLFTIVPVSPFGLKLFGPVLAFGEFFCCFRIFS